MEEPILCPGISSVDPKLSLHLHTGTNITSLNFLEVYPFNCMLEINKQLLKLLLFCLSDKQTKKKICSRIFKQKQTTFISRYIIKTTQIINWVMVYQYDNYIGNIKTKIISYEMSQFAYKIWWNEQEKERKRSYKLWVTLQPFFQYIIFHPTFHHQPNGAEKALAAIYWTILKYIYVLNQNNCTFIKYKWLYFSENLSSCQKCNLNKSTRKVFILEVWGATSLMEADLIFSHHTLECKISYKSLLNISIFGCFFFFFR